MDWDVRAVDAVLAETAVIAFWTVMHRHHAARRARR
jgi:hypothetical protein